MLKGAHAAQLATRNLYTAARTLNKAERKRYAHATEFRNAMGEAASKERELQSKLKSEDISEKEKEKLLKQDAKETKKTRCKT